MVGACDAAGSDQSGYYPTSQMPLAGQLPDGRRTFNELREQFLLAYTFPTARAYWSDLEQIADWAQALGKDVLALSQQDLRQHAALLRRRKYSESTIRRRLGTWKRFSESRAREYTT